ncbi:21143_t:CDS:2 [Dentiscutata erythropus]|uniref:21143_t:CDS:1 n=1 Tax=Dentiscutata erythropus TaxID=1348616 RepID=A0A9N8VCM3_9GLOM|nr:21143_t:CDS:2 [Dentiscutata erythropus]
MVGVIATPIEDKVSENNNVLDKRYTYGDICWVGSYENAPCYPNCGS